MIIIIIIEIFMILIYIIIIIINNNNKKIRRRRKIFLSLGETSDLLHSKSLNDFNAQVRDLLTLTDSP